MQVDPGLNSGLSSQGRCNLGQAVQLVCPSQSSSIRRSNRPASSGILTEDCMRTTYKSLGGYRFSVALTKIKHIHSPATENSIG